MTRGSRRGALRTLDAALVAHRPLLSTLLLAVLTVGVGSAVQLQATVSPVPLAAAPAPMVVLPAAELAPVEVAPVLEEAPEPVAAAPEPPAAAPAEPAPAPAAAPAAARPAPPVAPPAPADPMCSGPGWEQRRGEAALASLRRPDAAARFTVEYKPGRSDVIGLATVHERRLEVFVRTCDKLSDDLLRHVVGHELGHLVDGVRMDDASRRAYLEMRGIPADTPWYGCNSCADFATPAGDFAEVYSMWQRGGGPIRSQMAPPPSSAQLQELAARFFS